MIIPNYETKTKNFAIKELARILKLNESDFLFQLAGLYGKTLSSKKTEN